MRLPLVSPARLNAEQQTLNSAMDTILEGEEYAGFQVRNAEGAFVGPWGVMLHFPELAQPLAEFIDLAQKLPGLSERARQVVILTIGARFNVAYEMYAHSRLASRAGFRPDQVATLCAGGRPVDLTEEETLAADVAFRPDRGRPAARAAVRRRRTEAGPGSARRDRVHHRPLSGARRDPERL